MTQDFTKLFQTMMEQGAEMARRFNPALESFNPAAFDSYFPTMSRDMMEMWFGNTFNRDGLDAKTRLLLTLAALTAMGAQADGQIRLTIRHAMEAGATQREVAETIFQMSMFGGVPAMSRAFEIAKAVFAEQAEESAGDDA
ncbi:carboxymuconolactone decarboxylase family protein [Thioclava sp. GXIMD4216]|uniref:Carboxymuconolactone decarboxylase family protein n=1 Tax=Thioclava litoralis TaxID=3076557 RepID=A0ABZ1E1J4_9RHOB|nr:carboxymuconolactone decarboxylase family protein [Thioclava sp. FTW29]